MEFLMDPEFWVASASWNPIELKPLLVFLFALALLLTWLILVVHRVRIPRTSPSDSPAPLGPLPPISLVVSAHNERENLKQNLDAWLGQDYPDFEVVVIDDRSTDESHLVLLQKQQENHKLQVVYLDPDYVKNGGKKLALTLGFKKAKHAHLVLCDADCKPSSDQWLKHMAAAFQPGIEMVIASSPLIVKKGFLGGVIHFETLLTHLHFLGWALRNKPYMGLGRNLAYLRTAYDRVGGFSQHHHIPAGDDDLFVQSAATATNTAIVLNAEAFTFSPGAQNWKAYTKQKIRHLWVGKLYPGQVKRNLSLFPFTLLALLASWIYWWVQTSAWIYPALATALPLIVLWIVLHRKGKQLQMNQFSALFPLHLIFYGLWYLYMGIRVFFTKRILW